MTLTCKDCGQSFERASKVGREPTRCAGCAYNFRRELARVSAREASRRRTLARQAARAIREAHGARICACVGQCGRRLSDEWPLSVVYHPLCEQERANPGRRVRRLGVVFVPGDLSAEQIEATYTAALAHVKATGTFPLDGWDGYQVSYE